MQKEMFMDKHIAVRTCDTLIIGSSMAGACLARQLKLQHPDMDIVVLDRKEEFDYWVGESTLESFWDYAVKYLDLGFYLDTNHLYKHGLRFFYDSPEHDLPIDQMSEVGRTWFHSTPAHQLDRKRFDTDLYHMNLKSGIDVRLGCAVKDIVIDATGGHTVIAQNGEYRCRWLVDAAGMSTPLGRKLHLIRSNNDNHPINSCWGRFKNIANLDLLGDKEWRARVNHTTRTLATTHFMYGGYWMWLIPIDRETFSIGVTNRSDMVDIRISSADEFVDFLKTHQCMRQLIREDSELLDFHRLHGISRQATQVFSEDRWFMTGMSAAVLDPLLSPGSALLADNNRMIGDLIKTDKSGDERVFQNKVKAYNAYSKVWLENFFGHIKGHYHDCYDRQRANFETLLMQWFGIVLPISMAELWGYDPNMADQDYDMLDEKCMKMLHDSAIHKVDAVVEELHEYLKERGLEYQNNRGRFYDIEIGESCMSNTRTCGRNLSPAVIHDIEHNMLRVALKRALQRIAEVENLDCTEQSVDEVATIAANGGLGLLQAFAMLKKIRNGAISKRSSKRSRAA
jgi:FADH2 O2-dependent halogenase